MTRPTLQQRLAGLVVRLAARLVPRGRRARWLAEWRAELHHLQASRPDADPRPLRRSLGSLPDALWIRCHSWSFDMLTQDLRFALRSYLRSPAVAILAVLVLGIGIGGTAGTFGLVDALLLKPLPFPEPERLVRIYGTNPERGSFSANANPLDMRDLRAADAVVDVAYSASTSRTLTGADRPQRLGAAAVSANIFDVLGVTPEPGRGFAAAEDREEAEHVVVVTHDAWQRLFGADPSLVGRTLRLDGAPHLVVGVAPPGFQLPFGQTPHDLLVPLPLGPESGRGGHYVKVVARLAPGVSMEAARQELASRFAAIAAEHGKEGRGIRVEPLHAALVEEIAPLLLVLLTAVVLVLLLACANVAGLLLSRAAGRSRELAVRKALGASRGRLARQLLSESLLLAGASGLVAVVVARLTLSGLLAILGDSLPRLVPPTVDLRVLGFGLLVTLCTGLVFGAAPAWIASRDSAADRLRDGSRGTGSASGRLRSALVIAEVAVSLLLLVGAGLAAQSVWQLLGGDVGFDPDGVLTFRLALADEGYPELADNVRFFASLTEELEAHAGVEAAGAVNFLPLSGSFSCDGIEVEGAPPPAEDEGFPCAEQRIVAGDYLEAMGIRLVRGRWLGPSDDAGATPVAVINQTMARRFWPGEDPVGKRLRWWSSDPLPWRQVVGVVNDVRHYALDTDPAPEVYIPHAQYPYYDRMMLAVRTTGDPAHLVGVARDAVAALDPALPIYDVVPMRARMRDSILVERFLSTLLAVFSSAAVLLACTGLYGVLAHGVVRRRREFGIRMALGARGPDVRRLVLSGALRLVVTGLALGAVGAWILARSLAYLFHGVDPGDPVTYLVTAALVVCVALAASWVPARRAVRLDPVSTLRDP